MLFYNKSFTLGFRDIYGICCSKAHSSRGVGGLFTVKMLSHKELYNFK